MTPTSVPVNVTLEVDRFKDGIITFGRHSLPLAGNSTSEVYVLNTTNTMISISNGQNFVLYDDDDYNEDDTIPDGDDGEPITLLPESFNHLLAEDGNHSDGRPRNIYASAYIMPEYNWAQNVANYNQTNVTFNLNVPEANLTNQINSNRNSGNDEKDDFWIAYFLIAYQGAINEDADGFNIDPQTGNLRRDLATAGITRAFNYIPCDCYQSGSCVGISCAAVIPKGGIVTIP